MKNRQLLTYKLTNYFESSPSQEIVLPFLKRGLITNLLIQKNSIYRYAELLDKWLNNEKDELEIYYFVENDCTITSVGEKELADDNKMFFNYTVQYKNQKLQIKIPFI